MPTRRTHEVLIPGPQVAVRACGHVTRAATHLCVGSERGCAAGHPSLAAAAVRKHLPVSALLRAHLTHRLTNKTNEHTKLITIQQTNINTTQRAKQTLTH